MKTIYEVFSKGGREFEGAFSSREIANLKVWDVYLGIVKEVSMADDEYADFVECGDIDTQTIEEYQSDMLEVAMNNLKDECPERVELEKMESLGLAG